MNIAYVHTAIKPVFSSHGQVLIYLLIFLPLLLLIFGILYRSGTTLLTHNRLQSHCDRKVLEALSKKAEGLSDLGRLNSKSKAVIDLRRRIDSTLAEGGIAPAVLGPLLATRTRLVEMQRVIAGHQKMIMKVSDRASSLELEKKGEIFKQEKIEETFQLKSATEDLVTAMVLYKGESGAPLELKKNFEGTQRGSIDVHPESFLQEWPGLPKAEDMRIDCRAKIKIKKLEESWEVVLIR